MPLPIITYLIIGITCLVSYLAFNDPSLKTKLVFLPAWVSQRGETYRFISHGFVHNNLMHLVFNMYALYIFGGAAEYAFKLLFGQTFGGAAFLLFYLAALAVASFPEYLEDKSSYQPSLGASGAVAAVMWPFILFAPWNWFIFPPLPAILLGIGYIAYSHYQDRRGDQVARNADGSITGHSAHLWGAVFGLVGYVGLCAVLEPQLLTIFWDQLMQPQGPNF